MDNLRAVKLITEEAVDVRIVESVDNSGSKTLFLEGVYSTHSVKNKNGRMYKQDLLEREVKNILPKIKQRKLFGELNHPSHPDVDLERACILIESVDWKAADLLGKSSVLDTALGRTVAACLKRGVVGISSRGLGTVSESGWVNDDFQLLTWDVVSDPSNQKSWVKGICESKTYYINESGVVVREESALTAPQKIEAVATAVSEYDAKAKEMAGAVVEEQMQEMRNVLSDARDEILRLRKVAGLTNEEQNAVQDLSNVTEEQAKRIYKEILKESLKQTLEKMF